MKKKSQAIIEANAVLKEAGLPGYDELAVLLRAADNKFASMETYHSGSAASAIGAMRKKISALIVDIPFK